MSTSAAYNTLVTNQATNPNPIMVLVQNAISGTVGGATYDHPAGTLLYFDARTTAPATRPFIIPIRYETEVGATGSTLPVGAHTIVASARLVRGNGAAVKYSRTFLLSDLKGTAELWSMDSGNPSNYDNPRDFTISLAYNTRNRALTYTWDTNLQSSTISEQSIKAIGVTQ